MIHRLLLAAVVLVSSAVQLYAQNDAVMVLGTGRGELTDLEDRILREEIMRNISRKGFPVIPVLQIESVIYESRIDIRSIKVSEIISAGRIPGARYFIKGSFLRSKENLIYRLVISDSAGKDLGTREIALDLKEPVSSQWQKIAESAAEAVKQILFPPSAK